MSAAGLPDADDPRQPATFAFDDAHMAQARAIIAKYPAGRQASAVIPLLDLAQRQNGGWLPRVGVPYVADMLGMAEIRVWEVATFYTMFNLHPIGRHHVQVCTTTPCWLRGSADIVATCERVLGVKVGGTTEDGMFTLAEAECLGACVNAPMIQIGDDYYEDLDAESMERLIEAFRRGEKPKAGSQVGRSGSEPVGGLTTLLEAGDD